MSRKIVGMLVSTAVLVGGLYLLVCPHGPAPSTAPAGEPTPGEGLYLRHCAPCHGEKGDGNGPASKYLYPRPRNYTKGLFKLHTTPSGQLPTDDDLLRTISNGMPGSGMPSFAWLSEADRRALVDRVKALSVWTDEDAGETINHFVDRGQPPAQDIGVAPPSSPEAIARGKDVYKKLECFNCHGQTGKGDGPSAVGQTDSWGFPAVPRDFTTGVFRGGGTDADLYYRFTVGMPGTPMPAFSQVSDAERWDLVHYVQSLRRPDAKPWTAPADGTLHVARRAEPIPVGDAWGKMWEDVPSASFSLFPLWQKGNNPSHVRVRAVHDGKTVAVLMEWDDPTLNAEAVMTKHFVDAGAVMFSLLPDPPFLGMGESTRPCIIWNCRGDTLRDQLLFVDMEAVFPAMVADWYPMQFPDYRDTAGNVLPTSRHDPAFMSGWGAGNPISNPVRLDPSAAMQARGFGTLETAGKERQIVKASGGWRNGTWRMCFSRAMAAPVPEDVGFTPGTVGHTAFAVWDGALEDRNGQKSVSGWCKMSFDP